MRIGLTAFGMLVGFAGIGASVRAEPSCDVEALNSFLVPYLIVTEAKPRATARTTPAHCDARGMVITKGAGVAEGHPNNGSRFPHPCWSPA
jgi:hypothetical protein